MKRISRIISLLKKTYPEAKCALFYKKDYELLVATILSAQCTDKRVNEVTPFLFETYPTLKSLAHAPIRRIEKLVHSTGFYKNKARNIKQTCQKLLKKHQGKLPSTLEELVLLPGVGRKTANVILGEIFGIASGVVVDTHVTRLCYRMGLIATKNPLLIEKKLIKLLPKKHWIDFSHWLIVHGRLVCKARNPKCEVCTLSSHCPKKKYKLK